MNFARPSPDFGHPSPVLCRSVCEREVHAGCGGSFASSRFKVGVRLRTSAATGAGRAAGVRGLQCLREEGCFMRLSAEEPLRYIAGVRFGRFGRFARFGFGLRSVYEMRILGRKEPKNRFGRFRPVYGGGARKPNGRGWGPPSPRGGRKFQVPGSRFKVGNGVRLRTSAATCDAGSFAYARFRPLALAWRWGDFLGGEVSRRCGSNALPGWFTAGGGKRGSVAAATPYQGGVCAPGSCFPVALEWTCWIIFWR